MKIKYKQNTHKTKCMANITNTKKRVEHEKHRERAQRETNMQTSIHPCAYQPHMTYIYASMYMYAYILVHIYDIYIYIFMYVRIDLCVCLGRPLEIQQVIHALKALV